MVDNGIWVTPPPPNETVKQSVHFPSKPFIRPTEPTVQPLIPEPTLTLPSQKEELTPFSEPTTNLSPESQLYINPNQYITIMGMDSPLGKQFSTDENGKLTKQAVPNNGQGYCKTVFVPDAKTFKHYLEQVSLSETSAIILGFVKGTEPKSGEWEGEPYRLVTNAHLLELSGSTKKRSQIWKSKDGIKVAARTATMFERSTWICFDLDTNRFTPQKLKDKLDATSYMECLVDLVPQLEGIEYVSVPSSSARAVLNGELQYKVNHHIYMQTLTVRDQRRFAMAVLLKSQDTLYGYTIPAVNAQTKELESWRRPTQASIIDVSVFSKARIMFEGKPILNPNDPAVMSGALQIQPVEILVSDPVKTPYLAVDTSSYLDPIFNTQKRLGFEFINGVNGFKALNTTDLTPDVMIEWKSDETAETGFMTMKEFVDGTVTRLRCQNPFKPSSQSWSAFLSKENLEGEAIPPRLVSNEYGSYIYNNSKEAFDAYTPADETHTEITQTQAQPNQTPAQHEQSFNPLQPPQKDDVGQRLGTQPRPSPRKEVLKNAKSLKQYRGRIHQIPDQISDPLLGQFFIDRYFDDRPVMSVAHPSNRGSTIYEWNGFHYETVNQAQIKHYIVEGAKLGKLTSFTSTKLGSIVGMLSALSYAEPPEPLPKHITPFANGLFDFKKGVLLPHTPAYFYTKINDVFYNPDAKANVLFEVLENGSGGSEDWKQRLLDLLSYLLVSGDNTDHKIIWFDGLPRSGKSTLIKALLKLLPSYIPIELGDVINPKVLINCADKALVFDDDAQSPPFKDREAVTGTLKKMSTGALFEITQLYTTELFEASISAKMLFICNGIPSLYDPSGALVDRSEVHNFDVTYADNADTSIEERLNHPDELAGMFNVLWDNYLDLLDRSGYHSLEDYTNNPNKALKFHVHAQSADAKVSMRSENEPLSEFVEDCITFTGVETDIATNQQLIQAVRDYSESNPHLEYLKKWGNSKITRTLRGIMLRKQAGSYRSATVRGYSKVKVKPKVVNWEINQ